MNTYDCTKLWTGLRAFAAAFMLAGYSSKAAPVSNSETLPDACQRVAVAAQGLGLAIDIRVMADSTRTAEDAAKACGCDVAQIVKSLVFAGRDGGQPVLLLVSGAHRVDQEAVAAAIGEPLDRPSGRQVRDITGFAIGGIPPFGHASRMKTFIDPHLLSHCTVWAAAGTPLSVFSCDPAALQAATGALLLPVEALSANQPL